MEVVPTPDEEIKFSLQGEFRDPATQEVVAARIRMYPGKGREAPTSKELGSFVDFAGKTTANLELEELLAADVAEVETACGCVDSLVDAAKKLVEHGEWAPAIAVARKCAKIPEAELTAGEEEALAVELLLEAVAQAERCDRDLLGGKRFAEKVR